ncbi:terminase large subunit [Oceaniglobus trochenteri]|uniref:terminase large subunit n=1 Tax=Oceaniglobus trochenteri TaxID=2763260 RepID=UPI001CFFE6F6|nr:terminase large subunit [Oceaniglobus trochenteri]
MVAQTEVSSLGGAAPGWKTALPDWERRIRERLSLIPKLPLFDAVAQKALRIFKRLRVPDIMGTPTYGAACEEWVFDLVRVVFGSYDPATKRRMIREFFLLVPKKNGKSSIAAAIMVTAIIMNERPEAELLLIAPTKTIASISFKQAKGIIRHDAELTKLFHLQDHLKKITHRISLAEIVIKAADTDAITGGKATFTLIDETHEFATKSKAADVFTEVRGALAARPDGFLMQITTQSKSPPAGVFKAELEKARAVRDGKLDLPVLAVLYELPLKMAKDGGWKDPATWPMVNPNLGVSVDPAYLADELTAKEKDGAAALALLASQHFNVEIGAALMGKWIGSRHWPKAGDDKLTLDRLIERSEVAVVGVDGGGLDDLLGIAVLGRDRASKEWLHWGHAWAHTEVLETRKEIAPRLMDFAEAGDLTILEPDDPRGDVVGVADYAEQVFTANLLPASGAVGLDPFGISAIVDELALRGIGNDRLKAIGQGAQLSPAIWGLERKLKDGTFRHGARPMMDWVLGNAKSEQRGSAVIITKAASGKAKIDPLIAALNAFMLMRLNPVAAVASLSIPADYEVA